MSWVNADLSVGVSPQIVTDPDSHPRYGAATAEAGNHAVTLPRYELHVSHSEWEMTDQPGSAMDTEAITIIVPTSTPMLDETIPRFMEG